MDSTGTGGPANFECSLNGVDFESHPLLLGGASVSNAGVSGRTASGTMIENNGETVTIVISVTTFNESDFQSGVMFDAANGILGRYCIGNILIKNGPLDIDASSTDTETAILNITGYNSVMELWSGTFSFTAEDENTGNTYSVSNGLFENIEFD